MFNRFLVDLKNYKILEKINSGTFGSVSSVENIVTHEVYAAKTILNTTRSANNKKMVNREIGIMARMHHPTIIKFYGYSLCDFDGDNNVTILMSLAANGTLADLLQKSKNKAGNKKLNDTDRQKILVGIARGMMYLHQHHVIHRDLKPLNVLLDENLEPLITDFGLSKICNIVKTDVQTQAIGTSLYMAPEVINGDPYSGKADVYSFAILMYEVVTNLNPYPEAKKMTPYQFNDKVINENYRPHLPNKIKSSIRKLIEQCWSKNPHDRPTFEEIYNRLAYNVEESIYDIFETIEDDFDDEEEEKLHEIQKYKYYLDNADINEVLSYADKINDDDNSDRIEIQEMKQRIAKLENNDTDDIETLKTQINKIRKEQRNEIKDLQAIVDQMRLQMTTLIDENDKLKQQIKDLQSEKEIKEIPITETNNKSGIKLPFSEDKKFKGIINYIKTHSENIDDEINISSSSVQRNISRCLPKNVINYQSPAAEFCSKEEDSPWLCIDFKERRVIPNAYIIRSTTASQCGPHPKSWVIEGLNEQNEWKIIDNQKDCTLLNGKSQVGIFTIENPTNQAFSSLRIRLTGPNWYNRNVLILNNIDFYGELL